MTVIYKLMHHGERIAEWGDSGEAVAGIQAFLREYDSDLDSLRLVGFLTSYEHGATPTFTVIGADIPGYLAAAATVLAPHAEADDTARALGDLPDEQRRALFDLLRPAERRRVQALLLHGRPDAGELMRQQFICLYENQTAQEASDRVQRSALPDEVTAKIFVVNAHQRLEGAVTLRDLMGANPDTQLRQLTRPHPSARTGTKLGEIAALMAEYDTTIIPVIDKRERPAGVVTVDDVLELLLPTRWAQDT